MIVTSFENRQGHTIPRAFNTIGEARARYDYLQKVEADTVRHAPTDSGDVRFNYQREAAAIAWRLQFMLFIQ